MPNEVKEAAMDAVFTFIGDKKNRIYILTVVDRNTLYFGLGCGLDTNPGSDSTHDR
jgi:hypothetical protein